jgi:RNA polymerase-binding transcription factor DksA
MQAKSLEKNQLQSLELLLNKQRQEILSNGKTLRVDFNINKDEMLDEVDMAVNDIEQGMKMRLGNRESLYFRKVEEALLRIKEGTYGPLPHLRRPNRRETPGGAPHG